MNRKIFILLLTVLAMVLSLAACGAKEAPAVTEVAKAEAQQSGEVAAEATEKTETSGSRIVVDALGREVEVPAEVNRIVAMGNAPRLCSYLQLADKFVTTNQGDLSETVFMAFGWAYRDNWLDLPIAGAGGYGSFNAEAILEADPDVIVCTYEADIVASLEEQTGLPVVSVAQGVLYAEDYAQSLRTLGQVCGASERAEEVIAFVNACLEDLNNRTKDVADADKPLILGSAATFRGGHGIQGVYVDHPVFSAVNAKDAAIGLEKQYFDTGVEVDLEKILEWNPEVLFLDAGNLGLVKAEYAENPDFFQQLDAVQNGQVYQWPNSTSSSANLEISLVNTYYAGKILYPDAFADVAFEAKAEEIFEFFLGRTGYLEVLTEHGVGYDNITLGE